MGGGGDVDVVVISSSDDDDDDTDIVPPALGRMQAVAAFARPSPRVSTKDARGSDDNDDYDDSYKDDV